MQKPRSRSGGSTIMRRVPTLHCSGPHHQNSPVRQGKRPNRAFQRCWLFLLQTGTNSGVGSRNRKFLLLFGFFFWVGSRSRKFLLQTGTNSGVGSVYVTIVGSLTECGRGREHTTAYRARRRE